MLIALIQSLDNAAWMHACDVLKKEINGEVSEWLKEHAWKVCNTVTYRGFESLPLRPIQSGFNERFGLIRRYSPVLAGCLHMVFVSASGKSRRFVEIRRFISRGNLAVWFQ